MRSSIHGNSIAVATAILLHMATTDRILLNGRCRVPGCCKCPIRTVLLHTSHWRVTHYYDDPPGNTSPHGVGMRRSPKDIPSNPTSLAEPTGTAMANLTDTATTNSTNATTINPLFVWSAIGNSWTSGVLYSWSTIYNLSDLAFCYRTNQAWGA
jgi:hypothetical protein